MTNDKTGDIIKKNVKAIHAQNLVLESLNEKLVAERDEAIAQLKQANDLIEADTKARLVEEAAEHTTMSLMELAGKDIDDLETIITVSRLTKRQAFEAAADVAPSTKEKFNARTHLHGLYLKNKGG